MPPRNGRKVGMEKRHQQDRDAAGCRCQQAALDRAVEPEARRQSRRQHAGGEHDHHRAGEKQAKLDRREVQSLDQDARRRRKHREQSAHDQADGRGRNEKAAVGDQADIVSGDRERVERGPRRMMGFAEHGVIGERSDGRERCRQRRIRSASRNNDRARRRAAARSRARPPSRS